MIGIIGSIIARCFIGKEQKRYADGITIIPNDGTDVHYRKKNNAPVFHSVL